MEKELDTTQYWNKLVEEHKSELKNYFAEVQIENESVVSDEEYEKWLNKLTVMDLEVILEL